MEYTTIQPIALAILTSIITGGFVLVFVEIGNRKNRDNDRHDQIMGPFMHKLSAYLRFISWCDSRITYPKEKNSYEKHFKALMTSVGRHGGRAIQSGGDYPIGHFNAKELEELALNINNIWYWWDKMHPCRLTWEERLLGIEDYITKELKEIDATYKSLPHNVDLVAKVSGEFYTDIYQFVEYETYRHEAFQKQYNFQTSIVLMCFLCVLIVLCTMLFVNIPIYFLQIATTVAVFMLFCCIVLLSSDVRAQLMWKRKCLDRIENIKKSLKSLKSKINL